jgi:hypothetical protein
MNRLILIGNGFDLAHGLKTTYRDFIIWYVKTCFSKTNYYHPYDDPLISILTDWDYLPNQEQVISEWVNVLMTNVEHPKNRSVEFGWDEDDSHFKLGPFYIKIKPGLLDVLVGRCNESNWVDIETEYYALLKAVLESEYTETKQTKLVDLNQSLAFIISKLEEYLNTLPEPPFLSGYEKIFSSLISADDLYPRKSSLIVTPNDTHVLNFNYTDTYKQYLKFIKVGNKGSEPVSNHIHGQLNNSDNKLVFGFGDEIDSAYKRMEDDTEIKGYFDYIKSFWYLRADNYRSLVNFLDADDYQVYILGHSCGLSDRTMLKMIFEHEKCRSIKIYYHYVNDDDNFVSLTHAIAKHFTDKGMMRKRILSKQRSQPMPQITYDFIEVETNN